MDPCKRDATRRWTAVICRLMQKNIHGRLVTAAAPCAWTSSEVCVGAAVLKTAHVMCKVGLLPAMDHQPVLHLATGETLVSR